MVTVRPSDENCGRPAASSGTICSWALMSYNFSQIDVNTDRPTRVREVVGSSASGSADSATVSVPPALAAPLAGAGWPEEDDPIELQPARTRLSAAKAVT